MTVSQSEATLSSESATTLSMPLPQVCICTVRVWIAIKATNEGSPLMSEVTYVSRVRVDPVRGMIRRAHLPAEEDFVLFGAHGEIAEHYGASPDEVEPHASTLDYLVASAGG